MIELSDTELILLKDTLDRIRDEFETLGEHYVLNSGAVEEIEECLHFINALYKRFIKIKEEEFDDID